MCINIVTVMSRPMFNQSLIDNDQDQKENMIF